MRKHLFLYLAIACFAGLVAIFICDGYIGIYDSVRITIGEFEQEIGPDYWQGQPQRYAYPQSIGAERTETLHFRYEIDNRQFSAYSANVEASVWQGNGKVIDLVNQDIAVAGFDKVQLDWTLSVQELEKVSLEVDQCTVRIRRGGVELGQGIIVSFYDSERSGLKLPLPVSSSLVEQ